MLPHMLLEIVDISVKESDMSKLINLIMSDGLVIELSLDLLQVVEGCGNGCNSAARECDLGCG